MEALGFGFAVLGVFKNCLDGYEIIAGMSAQEKSSKILRCKLIVEERRLLSWGRAWGLMEHIYPGSPPTSSSNSRSLAGSGLNANFSSPESPRTVAAKARFRSSRNRQIKGVEWVIEEHLSSISELLSDATALQNRYGLSRGGNDNGAGVSSGKVSMAKKFRWAIADKEAFKELIADLRDLNDGLQTLLPENSRMVTEQALICEMASHDVISPRQQQQQQAYPWAGNGAGGGNGDMLPGYSPPALNGGHSRGTSAINNAMARMNVNEDRTPSPPPMVREDSLIGILAEALDDYPHLQRCMQLRKAQVRAGEPIDTWSPRQNLEIKPWRDKISLLDVPTPTKEKDTKEAREDIVRRTSATYTDDKWDDIRNCLITSTNQVLVEWKPYEDDRELTEERVQRLAELFHPQGGFGAFSATDGEMRILECGGWFHDSDRQRYGLVFHVPVINASSAPSHSSTPTLAPPKSPNPNRRFSNASKPPTPPPAYTPSASVVTLDDLLPSDSKPAKPDLGSRIILARTLARSLLQLHAANVLHKDLCSYNVLFFMPPGANDDVSSPYVSGFALARVDDAADDRTVTLASRSAARAMASSMLPYQHPEYSPALLRQICGVASTTSMYKRGYDVYSLGCVLLEIGLWRKLRTLGWRKEYEKSIGRERWRKKLVVICDELGARCGKIYEETVRRCLLYGDDGEGAAARKGGRGHSDEKDLLGFCYDILGRLEGIKV